MPFLETKDKNELYYRDWGSGAPVILIHGWPLSGDMWDKQATFLGENGIRVITYDRRGFGWSSKPWSDYGYDTLASDLHELIEHLSLSHVTLVGFSMGGGEVVRYLSKYGSARVRQAVLISSVTPCLLKTTDNPDGVEAKVFEEIEASIRSDRAAFMHDFGPKFYGRSMINHTVSEPVLEWTQQLAMMATTRSTLATAMAWSMTDFREEMKRITTPVTLIHGTSDTTVPIDASARLAVKLLPHGNLIEYDGEPHGLFLTAADKLNQELLRIIGGTPAPVSDIHLA